MENITKIHEMTEWNKGGIRNVASVYLGVTTWEDIFKEMVKSYVNNNKIIEE